MSTWNLSKNTVSTYPPCGVSNQGGGRPGDDYHSAWSLRSWNRQCISSWHYIASSVAWVLSWQGGTKSKQTCINYPLLRKDADVYFFVLRAHAAPPPPPPPPPHPPPLLPKNCKLYCLTGVITGIYAPLDSG